MPKAPPITAVCVPDVDAAVRWYESVLGLTVIWPATLMDGADIQRDMGELIAPPVALRAAILGVGDGSDCARLRKHRATKCRRTATTGGRFGHRPRLHPRRTDLRRHRRHARRPLEAKGVEFLTGGIAEIAGLRTTWFRDPWRNVFILMEKGEPTKPYYRQFLNPSRAATKGTVF